MSQTTETKDLPTPRTKALKYLKKKVEIRPFDEHKEEDGNHNFIHRMDAIAAVEIADAEHKRTHAELVAALEGVLNSAHPTPDEHPSMWSAWKTARQALARAKGEA